METMESIILGHLFNYFVTLLKVCLFGWIIDGSDTILDDRTETTMPLIRTFILGKPARIFVHMAEFNHKGFFWLNNIMPVQHNTYKTHEREPAEKSLNPFTN